eukprot:g77361.t1
MAAKASQETDEFPHVEVVYHHTTYITIEEVYWFTKKPFGCKKYTIPFVKRFFYHFLNTNIYFQIFILILWSFYSMIDVKKMSCAEKGCTTQPFFNFAGATTGMYCNMHFRPGMVDIRVRTCLASECSALPTYNFAGFKAPRYCANHKSDGMVIVKAAPGGPGEEHKLPPMMQAPGPPGGPAVMPSGAINSKEMAQWNEEEVAQWLRSLGTGKAWERYASNFLEQEVDGGTLRYLSREALAKQYSVKDSHVEAIIGARDQLERKTPEPSTPASPKHTLAAVPLTQQEVASLKNLSEEIRKIEQFCTAFSRVGPQLDAEMKRHEDKITKIFDEAKEFTIEYLRLVASNAKSQYTEKLGKVNAYYNRLVAAKKTCDAAMATTHDFADLTRRETIICSSYKPEKFKLDCPDQLLYIQGPNLRRHHLGAFLKMAGVDIVRAQKHPYPWGIINHDRDIQEFRTPARLLRQLDVSGCDRLGNAGVAFLAGLGALVLICSLPRSWALTQSITLPHTCLLHITFLIFPGNGGSSVASHRLSTLVTWQKATVPMGSSQGPDGQPKSLKLTEFPGNFSQLLIGYYNPPLVLYQAFAIEGRSEPVQCQPDIGRSLTVECSFPVLFKPRVLVLKTM